jgi:hypothetical protein
MPPCYTFNKILLPDQGLQSCASAGSANCPVQDWFWLAAAVAAVALLAANLGGSR